MDVDGLFIFIFYIMNNQGPTNKKSALEEILGLEKKTKSWKVFTKFYWKKACSFALVQKSPRLYHSLSFLVGKERGQVLLTTYVGYNSL